MRPVEKSIKLDANGQPLTVKHWTDAKKDLTKEIGCYCSYCEKSLSRSALDIEHIFPKELKDSSGKLIYDHLKFRWDNFLLSCKSCNSSKGTKDIAVLKPYMPHENNLLHYIEVIEGGLIQLKETISEEDKIRAKAFIDMVGLDRIPGDISYSELDDRWENRLKTFDLATSVLNEYLASTLNITQIIRYVSLSGFFSVWYYVFIGHDEVIKALIEGIQADGETIKPFVGIHADSFDPKNHYQTRPRHLKSS